MIYDGSHASVEWILASFYSRSRKKKHEKIDPPIFITADAALTDSTYHLTN